MAEKITGYTSEMCQQAMIDEQDKKIEKLEAMVTQLLAK